VLEILLVFFLRCLSPIVEQSKVDTVINKCQ
jgi:hypothetical protein